MNGLRQLGKFQDGVIRVHAQDGDGLVPAVRLGQGASDEAQADDADYHPSIASRILKIFLAVWANSSGVRD